MSTEKELKEIRPLPICFLEWVMDNSYIRFGKNAGRDLNGKWFHYGDAKNYTPNELFELFKEEVIDLGQTQ